MAVIHMLNFNFNMNPNSAYGSSFPGQMGAPGMMGGDMGMASMQQMFTQSMDLLSMSMMTMMTQMMTQQVALLGKGAFGKLGGKGGSPLAGFLGGAQGANGASSKRKGEKIPGGLSLYKGKGMFHKGAPGAPNTYAFENSPAGIRFAAKHGYKSIDIDMQITKDGVPVATHWSQPMKKDGFHDPKGKLGKNTKISDMTLAEVMRLRNKDGQSQIYPVATMIKELKANGIAGDFEAKNDPRFATDKVMGYLADLVRDAGIKANLKSIDRNATTVKILRAAQRNGFWARIALDPKHGHPKNWGYGS